jgi:hypothetical protein
MLKHLTLAALLATSVVPLAHAQERDDEDSYRMERPDRDRDRDRDKDRDRDRDRDRDEDRADRRDDRPEPSPRDMRYGDRWARADEPGPRPGGPRDMMDMGPRGMGPRGDGPRRGPPPAPPMPMAGFSIDLGEGRSLDVRCGDEPIADCIEAAQPIISAMRGETAGTEVPPPPRSLVTPPESGATPPPPPTGDAAPTPPPAN